MVVHNISVSGVRFQGQSYLHIAFQTTQGYVVRPCLKNIIADFKNSYPILITLHFVRLENKATL